MSEQVIVEVQDAILRIQINRPEKKNALLPPMYAAMAQALEAVNADPDVRVALIHGIPGAFTAGNDLADFLDNPPKRSDAPVFRFLNALTGVHKPLIAAVSGVAVGVGTTMLLHCDFVYAAPDARFRLPFVHLGLCPEAASSLLLPRLAGHVRAAEALMLGEAFDAEKARSLGLINAIVPAERLLATAMEVAGKLAALPAGSLRATKFLMKTAQAQEVERHMSLEAENFKLRLDSPEAREAFSAFLEKRKPDFSRFA
ncbi:MAG TPA: enoyl-CoA hydratase [Rhodocyclaceae bacterium]|nr:MAG: enoyl-CoA hydratase [Betaproteobacteria bacterium CG2_30_68_42]HCX32567.1 enoyl-CoA hydratase [Rhodocyclaceae bacterium]